MGGVGQESLLLLGIGCTWTVLGSQGANTSQLGLSSRIHRVPSKKALSYSVSGHAIGKINDVLS